MKVRLIIAGEPTEVEMTPEELVAYQKAMGVSSPSKPPAPARNPARRTPTADSLDPPDRATLKAFILRRPNGRHGMADIFEEFAGGQVPALIERDGRKANNPVYARWKHHADNARKEIEGEKGRKFATVNHGGRVTYFFGEDA